MIFRSCGENVLFLIVRIKPITGNYSELYFLASDTQEIETWQINSEHLQDHQKFAKYMTWTLQ